MNNKKVGRALRETCTRRTRNHRGSEKSEKNNRSAFGAQSTHGSLPSRHRRVSGRAPATQDRSSSLRKLRCGRSILRSGRFYAR